MEVVRKNKESIEVPNSAIDLAAAKYCTDWPGVRQRDARLLIEKMLNSMHGPNTVEDCLSEMSYRSYLVPSRFAWIHRDGRAIFVNHATHEEIIGYFDVYASHMENSGWARMSDNLQHKYRLTEAQRRTLHRMGLGDKPSTQFYIPEIVYTGPQPPLDLGIGVKSWPNP